MARSSKRSFKNPIHKTANNTRGPVHLRRKRPYSTLREKSGGHRPTISVRVSVVAYRSYKQTKLYISIERRKPTLPHTEPSSRRHLVTSWTANGSRGDRALAP